MKRITSAQRLHGLALAGLMALTGMATMPAMAQEPKTLVVGTGAESLPYSMETRRSRFFTESEILDTLVRLDYGMNLVPALATSWERVSDLVWKFTLRENVVFHDGTPMTAETVKASLDNVTRLLPYASDLLNTTEVRVTGPLEIEIETKSAFAGLPNQLTDAITVIYAPSSFDADGKFIKPVGTGPWEFIEYVSEDRTVVERFDGYWGDLPDIERIEYRFIPDGNARVIALENGEIHFTTAVPTGDVARLEQTDGITIHSALSSGITYGAFNTREGRPLHDVRVRQAINLLVDRELAVEAALDGYGRPAWTFFAPQFEWVPEGVKAYSYDPEAAAVLLNDAGYEKIDGKWSKDGAPFVLEVQSYSNAFGAGLLAESMSALLNREGIETKIGMHTYDGMVEFAKRGEFDIAVQSWTPEMTGHPDLHLTSQFLSTAELNHQGWANPRFDELVEYGRGLEWGAEWDETYLEIFNILQDDAPVIPLAHAVFVAASTDRLEGFRVHASRFFYDLKSVTLN